MKKYAIGFDIGGTKCAVVYGSYDEQIEIIDKIKFATSSISSPLEIVYTLCDKTIELLKKHGKTTADIEGIGISCGSPLDPVKGIIQSPPNLPGWDNIEIVDIVNDRLGVKAKLQNDANACALAEWKYGAGRGSNNMIFLTFGTGFGAGLILDGRLYNGVNCMAGEIGHVRLSEYGPVGYGKAGSCEGYCSGGGIVSLAQTRVLEELQKGKKVSFCPDVDSVAHLTAKIVGDAAEDGDELAKAIYAESGKYLGRAVSVLVDLLNPDKVVIGSFYARSTELLRSHMLAEMEKECLPVNFNSVEVVPAELGDSIGDIASLAIALVG